MIFKDFAIQTTFAHLLWSHQRNRNIRNLSFFFSLTRNSIIYFLNVELSLFPWIFCYFLKLQQGTPTSTGAQLGLGLRVDGVTLILDHVIVFLPSVQRRAEARCPAVGQKLHPLGCVVPDYRCMYVTMVAISTRGRWASLCHVINNHQPFVC